MKWRCVAISFPPSLLLSSWKRLYERLWFFITESLLAFTIFRDEFDTPFALMFGFLLFVKSFHWLASDRIEWVRLEALPEATLFNDSLIDGSKAVPWPSTAVSSENEHSLRHTMGYRPHHVCFCR